MPTSPATDMLSPAAPQDTSLLSSPRPSGTNTQNVPSLSYFGLFQPFPIFSVVTHLSLFLTVLPNEVDMSSPLMYGTPSSRVEGTPRSGVRGTPARQRPDLGSVRKAPQVDLHSEPVSGRVGIIQIVLAFYRDCPSKETFQVKLIRMTN